MTPQEQLELEILEHIYENDEGRLREPANLGPLYERFGEEPALSACHSLRLRGLIEMDSRLSGGYHTLPEGRTVVEAMRERRNDRGYQQLLTDRLLDRVDRRPDRLAVVLRRTLRGGRGTHRVPRDPQRPGDQLDRQPLRSMQPADLSPVLH
ncbi:MAG: hypothetical protein JWR85_687 [Marmoricola sp.]|nr:hypothetical protein [Marmoricola sp.]